MMSEFFKKYFGIGKYEFIRDDEKKVEHSEKQFKSTSINKVNKRVFNISDDDFISENHTIETLVSNTIVLFEEVKKQVDKFLIEDSFSSIKKMGYTKLEIEEFFLFLFDLLNVMLDSHRYFLTQNEKFSTSNWANREHPRKAEFVKRGILNKELALKYWFAYLQELKLAVSTKSPITMFKYFFGEKPNNLDSKIGKSGFIVEGIILEVLCAFDCYIIKKSESNTQLTMLEYVDYFIKDVVEDWKIRVNRIDYVKLMLKYFLLCGIPLPKEFEGVPLGTLKSSLVMQTGVSRYELYINFYFFSYKQDTLEYIFNELDIIRNIGYKNSPSEDWRNKYKSFSGIPNKTILFFPNPEIEKLTNL